MTQRDEPPVLQGKAPSEEDEFFLCWGRETLKNNLTFVNEVLRQLVALNSVLLGGGIAFLDDNMMSRCFRGIVIFSFLFSLIVSFLGMMPYEGKVNLRDPNAIRRHKNAALRWKRCFVWIAGAAMAFGFGVCIVGLKLH